MLTQPELFFDHSELELSAIERWNEERLSTPKKKRPKVKGSKMNASAKIEKGVNTGLTLKTIKPMTDTQSLVFEYFGEGNNVVLHGCAGTGKSFLSVYLAMKELQKDKTKKKVVIIRSAVASRKQGFLPGTKQEKEQVYEAPYFKIFSDLYGRGDAYKILKTNGMVEFESTSYLRGTTYEDCIIILDEFQNCTYQELSTVLTRIGQNCRIMIAGDTKQSDLLYEDEINGVHDMIKILRNMKSVAFAEFKIGDIVRSGFVKEFLIASDQYFSAKRKL